MTLKHLFMTTAFVAATVATPALASITITFDELNGSVNESPLNYYAGGSGSAGTTGGPNYGITFSSNSITGCVDGTPCDNTNAAMPPSSPNILFFLSGGASTMNVAGGFTTGFSFYYSAANNPGSVNVYSGLDGTGTLLASLSLPTNSNSGAPGCTSAFCPFTPIGVSFAGTAYSVGFAGSDNQIAFDNITIGSVIPGGGGVPEPATWALMIMGFGAVGGAMRVRRRGISFANA